METDSYDNLTSTAVPVTNNQRPANRHEYMNTISLITLCVVFVFGTVGNGLVIYVTGFRMKRTVNSIWFLNLASADFIFTSFLIFLIISLSKDYHWPFGGFMCKLNSVIAIGNMFASVFFLTAISMDRCLCSWVVVWSQNHRTVRKAQLICAGIWLASLACSIPYGYSKQVFDLTPQFTICAISKEVNKLALTYFQFIVGFLIPMLVIAGSYTAIGMRMKRFNRAKSRKSLRIIIGIILAFVVCWIPYHVHKYIEVYGTRGKIVTIRRILGPLSSNLTTVNSCLNPLLYVFMCDEFIKKLKQSLFLVLETALAEDYLSIASNNSRNISRLFRRSESGSGYRTKETSATIAETLTQVHTSEE